MENIIAIPIFKENLSELEMISVQQCFKIFSSRKIFFVHPPTLKLGFYKENFQEAHYEEFAADFFRSIKDYNRLMLSSAFYNRFLKYDFLLVYQTDCYVFRDELDHWAGMGYDYIGGIWFENYSDTPESGNKIWIPGNGGFSLRRIKKIYKILNSKKPFYPVRELFNNFRKEKTIKTFLLFLFKIFGYQNNISYLSKINTKNEDVFYYYLSRYKVISIPKANEALLFSWDRRPDFMYSLTSELPFGAHAWYRQDDLYKKNLQFWRQFIDVHDEILKFT